MSYMEIRSPNSCLCGEFLELGFYHVEIPSVESTQWLNLTNCGVVRVISWQISLAELEGELSEIYCKEWP